MRKALAIIGLFIAIAGTIVLVTYKYQKPNCEAAQESPDQSKSTVTVLNAPSHPEETDNKKNQSQNCVPWWHVLIAFPDGITTWAIIATLLVIGWQSYETARAAKYGAIAAQAALESAKGFVKSERALIVVRRKPSTDPDKCQLIGINRGRTSAEVCEIADLIEIQDAESQVPCRALEPLPLPRSALTTSGHGFPVREVSFEWCKQKIEKSTVPNGILLAFVEIKYWDMFTDRKQASAKPHTTRMCFSVDPYKRRLHRKTTDWTCHE
ncbi:MAG: hypothetical protein ABSC88_05165 [Terracidiphilus sp.]|jgi:hypothetical protein